MGCRVTFHTLGIIRIFLFGFQLLGIKKCMTPGTLLFSFKYLTLKGDYLKKKRTMLKEQS